MGDSSQKKLLTKEDVILLYIANKEKLKWAITARDFQNSSKLRQAILEIGDPDVSYFYAFYYDKAPKKDTRKLACTDPKEAYWYARNIDKKPRTDTRSAACKSPEYAYYYAKDVDLRCHFETRSACCEDPEYAYLYARRVDRSPRDDTRKAAYKGDISRRDYIAWVQELGEDV